MGEIRVDIFILYTFDGWQNSIVFEINDFDGFQLVRVVFEVGIAEIRQSLGMIRHALHKIIIVLAGQ